MENESAQPPAGWYSDPAGSGGFRYWDGSVWSDKPVVSKIPEQRRHWLVYGGRIAGILIAVSPLFIAYVGSFGSDASMFDESQGSGAAIFLIIYTVPLGALIAKVCSIIGGKLQLRAKH